MGALEMEPKIAAALRQSFPLAEEGQILRWATAIYDTWSPSAALDALQRNDKPSGQDINSLEKAVRQLRGAAKELNKVGWHGGEEICDHARRFARSHNESAFGVSPVDAGSTIADHINGIADAMETAAGRIPKDALTVNSHFGTGPGFERHTGRPRNAAARAVADECRNAFLELTGTRATVITSWEYATASGAFLEMVGHVFNAMDIKASAETWARAATRLGENPTE